jgi:hypothetical protein
MITTQVTFSDFWGWLNSSDGYKNSFSYEGAKALFEYLEEATDNGGEVEPDNYDPVAWCCEFSEYADLDELKENYDSIESMEDLQNNTIVISESPLVIADF